MIGFGPFKKHANQFTYTPRYYNPEKERREERRAALHGDYTPPKSSAGAEQEYAPGDYIRARRQSRVAKIAEQKQRKNRSRILPLVIGIVLFVVFMVAAYPRLVAIFERMQSPTQQRERLSTQPVEGEFDPSAPITVVPNDYEGE